MPDNLVLKAGELFYCDISYSEHPFSWPMKATEVRPPVGQIDIVIATDIGGNPCKIHAQAIGVELRKMGWYDRWFKYSDFPRQTRQKKEEDYREIPPRQTQTPHTSSVKSLDENFEFNFPAELPEVQEKPTQK